MRIISILALAFLVEGAEGSVVKYVKTEVKDSAEALTAVVNYAGGSLSDSDLSIRSTNDFLQIEIPDLHSAQGQQLFPLGKGLMKSVLVAPTADGKGLRVKFYNSNSHRGTIDPSVLAIVTNQNRIELSLAKRALAKRLHVGESIRQVLIGGGKPPAEPLRLVVEPKEELSAALAEDRIEIGAVEKIDLPSKAEAPLRAKTEADIPITPEKPQTASGKAIDWRQMAFGIGATAFAVISLLVFVLKFTKKKSLLSQAPKMRIINQFHIGPKKQLMVVQVAGESLLLGVTDQNINLIKNLSLLEEELPTEVPNTFKGAMRDSSFVDDSEGKDEDYAMAGLSQIRDRVTNRLGKMRSFT